MECFALIQDGYRLLLAVKALGPSAYEWRLFLSLQSAQDRGELVAQGGPFHDKAAAQASGMEALMAYRLLRMGSAAHA